MYTSGSLQTDLVSQDCQLIIIPATCSHRHKLPHIGDSCKECWQYLLEVFMGMPCDTTHPTLSVHLKAIKLQAKILRQKYSKVLQWNVPSTGKALQQKNSKHTHHWSRCNPHAAPPFCIDPANKCQALVLQLTQASSSPECKKKIRIRMSQSANPPYQILTHVEESQMRADGIVGRRGMGPCAVKKLSSSA